MVQKVTIDIPIVITIYYYYHHNNYHIISTPGQIKRRCRCAAESVQEGRTNKAVLTTAPTPLQEEVVPPSTSVNFSAVPGIRRVGETAD